LFFELVDKLDDYITWVKRDEIKTQFSSIGRFFKNKTKYYSKVDEVRKFNEIFGDFDNYIVKYNQEYVTSQKERLKHYFDDIEGKVLDEQQRTAVITDEYSNLIVAGAGSGKTLTILGKVKYLIEQKNSSPDNILLLSFTKKTVEDLNDRLNKINLGIQATTFHKLGYDIIKKFNKNIPAVTNENTLNNVVKEYLKNEIFNNKVALQSFIQYVACYMNIPEEYDNFNSLGEKINIEKGIDFQTLKSKCEPLNKVSKSSLDTMKGERVKSVEELIIANFLYLNGIEYEYEQPYPYGDVMYRPDFFLKEYDIYLEHFGIDENNRAKWLSDFNEKEYIRGMELKREAHKTYNTKLVETYSYYNRDNILLQKLEEILKAEKVIFKPRDSKDIYEKVTENDENFGKEIIKLIESFINLSKSRKLKVEALKTLFQERAKSQNEFMSERQELFLNFVLPILEKYDTVLKERNEIDFNDMINKATDEIQVNQPIYNYQYIIIDEYQDISFARFNLIKEIRQLSGARLICVGDDWQSIYRFAGSDISLFSNFEKYVGKYELLLIEQTYRNAQSLIDITSKYIQKNKKQITKNPKSKKGPVAEPIKFVNYKQEEVEQIFISEIQQLIQKYGKKSILVLGRHSFDINDLIKLTQSNKIKFFEASGKIVIDGFEDVDIKFLTVHKSKGTEADNVVILNLKNHLLGFPNKMTDDPILSLLMSDSEEYRFAEERRLFYVALTRTKNEVVVLMPSDVSLFAEELLIDNNYLVSDNQGSLHATNCPYCQTGKLVIRQISATNGNFLGCSHYPICDQTFNDINILKDNFVCPKCDSGFMVKRTGKFGDFLGCTNYPRCKNTINFS
jgi:DNA helicase-4